MRYAIIASLTLTSLSVVAQQDIHLNRLTLLGGATRYIGDIERPLDAFDLEHSAFAGLVYQRFLGYGTSVYTQVAMARLQGNDLEGGIASRGLNFRSELSTLELGFRTYLDNGSWLNYDARFAPFFSIGAGAGSYTVRVDQFDAMGRPYNYWQDGTVRDLPESSPNAAQATITGQDGNYGTDVTKLGTEDGKPGDPHFFYIPAQLGLKLRLSQYFSLELAYGFNWTFSDHLDDISGAYPNTTDDIDLNYLSNPTNATGSRGDSKTNDHYHTVSLGLAVSFGSRSKRYRMTPIHVGSSSTEMPDSSAKSKAAAQPVQEQTRNSDQEMDTLRVRTLIIERIIVDTLEVRGSLMFDSSATQPLTDSSKVEGRAAMSVERDSSFAEPSPDSTRTLIPDSTVQKKSGAVQELPAQQLNDSTKQLIAPVDGSRYISPTDSTTVSAKSATPRDQQPTHEGGAARTQGNGTHSGSGNLILPIPLPIPINNNKKTSALEESLAEAQEAQRQAEAELEQLRNDTLTPSGAQGGAIPNAIYPTTAVPIANSVPDTVQQADSTMVPNDQAIRDAQRKRLNSLMLERMEMIESYLAMQAAFAPDSAQRYAERQVQMLDLRIIALRDSLNTSATLGQAEGSTLQPPKGEKEHLALVDTVYFATSSSIVQERYKGGLMEQAEHYLRSGKGKLLVTGHSDSSGAADFSLSLSEARAAAVAKLLHEAGVPENSMIVKGLGERLARSQYSALERNVLVQMVVFE